MQAKWAESDTYPNAVIVEEYFAFTSHTGLELIQTVRKKWENINVSYGLLTQVDDLEKRKAVLVRYSGVD